MFSNKDFQDKVQEIHVSLKESEQSRSESRPRKVSMTGSISAKPLTRSSVKSSINEVGKPCCILCFVVPKQFRNYFSLPLHNLKNQCYYVPLILNYGISQRFQEEFVDVMSAAEVEENKMEIIEPSAVEEVGEILSKVIIYQENQVQQTNDSLQRMQPLRVLTNNVLIRTVSNFQNFQQSTQPASIPLDGSRGCLNINFLIKQNFFCLTEILH